MIQKSLIPWNIDYRSSLRIVKRVIRVDEKNFKILLFDTCSRWSVKITTEFLLEKGKNCNLLLYRSTVCSNPTNNFLMRWIFDVGSKFRKRWWGKEGESSGARGTGRGKDKGKNRGEKARKRGKYSYVSRRNPRNLS